MTSGFQESPEERLFKAALGFAENEREEFIRASADGDEELAAAALLLLEGYQKLGGDSAEATMNHDNSSARKRWATSTEEPDTIIGDFTLVRKIGEGGMGTVWEAEQSGAIARRVALKLIKLGMDTAEVVKRFERERQTLAMLEHPNIAQVLEAGATDLGRPYFVMEFVEGEPITDYCARHNVSLKDRLDLVLAVCSGIELAHRKGVIHRDLKPSNILVGAAGSPKIIDFGIAKAAADEGGTLFTRDSQMLGTPAYMSPEQASGKMAAIDTRSDVYSLGVVLYELLAGAPPFNPERLASTGIVELQKILTTEEPPKPSSRRTTMSTVSGAVPQEELRVPDFERDLDWIVMKAMAKEAERRYVSAAALGDDLQRYLNGETVNAVPPSTSYRLGKFVRRNKLAVGAAAAIFIALVGGMVVSLVQMKRANEHADLADAARREATLTVSDMQANNGANAARNGEPTIAALWFAKAATSAEGDPNRIEANRRRTVAWRQDQRTAVRAFDPGRDFAMEMSWNPKHPALLCLFSTNPQTYQVLDVTESTRVWRPDLTDVNLASWSPDGNFLLVYSLSRNRASVLAYPSGEEITSLDEVRNLRAIGWHPGGRKLLLDGLLWDLDTGEAHRMAKSTLQAAAFSRSGNHLLLQNETSTEIRSAQPPFDVLHVHSETNRHIPAQFLGNGEHYAVATESGAIVACDTLTGETLGRYDAKARTHSGELWSSANGRYVIQENEDLIDLVKGESISTVPDQRTWQAAAFDPRNHRVAIGGDYNIIELWSLAERRLIQRIGHPHARIHSLCFSPDGQYLAAGEEGLLRVWRTEVPVTHRTMKTAGDSVALSSDGKRFAPVGSTHAYLSAEHTSIYDVSSGEPISPEIHPGGILKAGVFDPDGHWLALSVSTTSDRRASAYVDRSGGYGKFKPGSNGGGSGNVQLWSTESGERIGQPFAMPSDPGDIDVHPSGRFLAVVCSNAETVEIDLQSGSSRTLFKESEPLNTPNHIKNNGRCSYTADGTCIIRWGVTRGTPIWHREREEFIIKPDLADVQCSDLSLTEEVLALAITSPGKNSIHFLDPATGKAITDPLQQSNWTMVSQLDGSGTRLLVGGHDNNAQVWHWDTRKPLGPSLPHSKTVFSGTFLPGDNMVATSGADALLRFWDYQTGLPTRPNIPSLGAAIDLQITANQRTLVATDRYFLSFIDLDEAFPQPELTAQGALKLAEIDANAEILASGGVARLNGTRWMEKWRAFRRDYPDFSGHRISLDPENIITRQPNTPPVDKALAVRLAASTLITPTAVQSSTALDDPYPVHHLIDGSGLSNVLTDPSQISRLTHSGRGTWVTKDNIPDYFAGPGALPAPLLTFTLPEPTEVSAIVQWPYRFNADNAAQGNQPSRYHITLHDIEDKAIGAPINHQLKQPLPNRAYLIPLPSTPGVKTVKIEFFDNFHPDNGGDRVGLGEVRFLSEFRMSR